MDFYLESSRITSTPNTQWRNGRIDEKLKTSHEEKKPDDDK